MNCCFINHLQTLIHEYDDQPSFTLREARLFLFPCRITKWKYSSLQLFSCSGYISEKRFHRIAGPATKRLWRIETAMTLDWRGWDPLPRYRTITGRAMSVTWCVTVTSWSCSAAPGNCTALPLSGAFVVSPNGQSKRDRDGVMQLLLNTEPIVAIRTFLSIPTCGENEMLAYVSDSHSWMGRNTCSALGRTLITHRALRWNCLYSGTKYINK